MIAENTPREVTLARTHFAMGSFRTNAMAGGVLATVLLAGGMLLSIQGFETLADSQVEFLRAQEQEITLTERLRWSGEFLTSAGRGYLISNDPALLTRLLRVRREFDQSIAALRSGTLTPQSETLVVAVERDARRFVAIQEELAAERTFKGDARSLILRFERDLLPLQRQLSSSLDDLVAHQEAALDESYGQARQERYRVKFWMYLLLTTLIFLGAAITVFFAKQTARAYRKEHKALDVARKAVSVRDDLMSMVAHDLRNPLFAIGIQARTLQEHAESDGARGRAESIIELTTRMERLIKSMLDITSIEAGRFSVKPAPHAVDELLRESLRMFDLIAARRQIQVLQQISHAGLVARADRERVLQLLSNLIGNALKFAPDGSTVIIQIERQQQVVRFAVRDQGRGIASEHLPFLFDRFWKPVGGETSGTGLGLFIAKGIVEAHGGRIWAESEPGSGATFYFTLPLCSASTAEEPTRVNQYQPEAALPGQA